MGFLCFGGGCKEEHLTFPPTPSSLPTLPPHPTHPFLLILSHRLSFLLCSVLPSDLSCWKFLHEETCADGSRGIKSAGVASACRSPTTDSGSSNINRAEAKQGWLWFSALGSHHAHDRVLQLCPRLAWPLRRVGGRELILSSARLTLGLQLNLGDRGVAWSNNRPVQANS